MNAPLKASWSACTLPVSRTAHPSSPPESGPRPTFNPSSVDPANLALLARLEKAAPTTIPPIHRLDLAWSCELARLARSDGVPPEVREGACAMLRRSVDGLVRFWARSKASLMPRMRQEDLMQEAAMKVLRATALYNPNDPEHPENRVPFGAYARTAVLREIQRCGDDTGSDIRRPVDKQLLIRKIAWAERVFQNDEGRCPTNEEIAELLEISPEQVRKAKEARRVGAVSSLDKPVGEDGDATLLDLKADSGPSPEGIVLSLKGREELQRALAFLRWSEREILTLRFGLEDGISLSLEEVGDIFDLTRERIRQIEKQALESLRDTIPRLEDTRAAELFLRIRKPLSESPDRDLAEGFSAFFEQRKIMIKAASQAKGKNRRPSLNDIARRLNWDVGLLWRRIHEDPVLRMRWSHLLTRVGVPWPDWIRRVLPVAKETALKEERSLERQDIARIAGCSTSQLGIVLRKDDDLKKYVDQQIEESVYLSRRERVRKAAEAVRRKLGLPAEAPLPVEPLCEELGVTAAMFLLWRKQYRAEGKDLLPVGFRIAERRPKGFIVSKKVQHGTEQMEELIKEKVAEAVRKILKKPPAERNLSVDGVAEEIGVDPITVSRWNRRYGNLYPREFYAASPKQAQESKRPSIASQVMNLRRTEVAEAYRRAVAKCLKGHALTLQEFLAEWGRPKETLLRWRKEDEGLLELRKSPRALNRYEVLGVAAA